MKQEKYIPMDGFRDELSVWVKEKDVKKLKKQKKKK